MIRIPDPDSTGVVADWIELFVATTDLFVSKANLSHLLENASGTETSEAFICDIWRELAVREKMYRPSPFTVDRLVVERVEGQIARHAYLACLLISLFGVTNKPKGAPKLFERLCSFAVKAYLSGEAIVFGWPVEPGGSSSIRDRVIEVATRLNEKYVESPAKKYKDRGVDVVAWSPFAEQRPSQVVVLLQCAAGRDWRAKATDLPLDAWGQYIHWSCNPMKAFAVPCIIPERDWHEVSKEGGVLFDRIRVTNLTSELEKEDKALAKDISRFVARRLEELT